MKILICSGVYPPDIGGPGKYAKNLNEEFSRRGHQVKVLHYQREKKMPIGFRHLWFFLRTLVNLPQVDLVIALDMFSTGWPAVTAAKLFRKKIILRAGGDFLWETYVEKTGHLIKLPDFYTTPVKLPFKHHVIKYFQTFTLRHADALAFNSVWLENLFRKFYDLDDKKLFVVENYYGEKKNTGQSLNKNFLFIGRGIKFKNLKFVEEVFGELKNEGAKVGLEIADNLSGLEQRTANAYALLTLSISDFAPNFIIEGLSFEKPFILTRDCGLKERIGELGIFVDTANKDEVKQAVLSLLKPEVYDNYARKINNFNFSHSWPEIADEFLKIYNGL